MPPLLAGSTPCQIGGSIRGEAAVAREATPLRAMQIGRSFAEASFSAEAEVAYVRIHRRTSGMVGKSGMGDTSDG